MITILGLKNLYDIKDFLESYRDIFQELFITKNNERLFLKTNDILLEKLLKTQLFIGQYEKDKLNGFLIVYKEKGFRPYLKIAGTVEIVGNLIKYLTWNYCTEDLYLKIKKNNTITSQAYKYGFKKIASRGNEDLFFRQRSNRPIMGGKLDDNDNWQDKKFSK